MAQRQSSQKLGRWKDGKNEWMEKILVGGRRGREEGDEEVCLGKETGFALFTLGDDTGYI